MTRGLIVALLLTACAPTLTQLPAHAPHARVTIRFIHRDRDLAFENGVILDGQRSKLPAQSTLRLAPGQHQLTLHSTGRFYALGTQIVSRPVMTCFGATCIPQTVREPRTVLVESGSRDCWQTRELNLTAGHATSALLVTGPGSVCEACVVNDADARGCPRGPDHVPVGTARPAEPR